MTGCEMVIVEWVDAQAANEWTPLDDPSWHTEPGLIHSMGWIVSDKPTHVTLAASRALDGSQASGDMKIPRACIRSIKRLCYHGDEYAG